MEENRKGPGVFYAVVGVATLVVAIIGATFAYFSASATPGEGSDDITGDTLNIAGGVLSVSVDRVEFADIKATSDDLVPAYFGEDYDPTGMTSTEITRVLTAKCENDGYTGCHLWKIDATTSQSITNANLLLDLTAPAVQGNSDWSYAVFTATSVGTDGSSSGVTLAVVDDTSKTNDDGTRKTSDGNAVGSFGTAITDLDIHNNAALTVVDGNNVTQTYYLLVYLNDDDKVQNQDEANLATGTYNGNVELQALGGTVRASFAA